MNSARLRVVQPRGSQQPARRSTRTVYFTSSEAKSGLRFRSDGLKSHRERLGLSAREMGLLLGASQLSVYKWEQGKARPRGKHLEAIAALRSVGKREVQRRISELVG